MDWDERGGREKLGGIEGRETIIRIDYIKEKDVFNKKLKNFNLFKSILDLC